MMVLDNACKCFLHGFFVNLYKMDIEFKVFIPRKILMVQGCLKLLLTFLSIEAYFFCMHGDR